MDKGSDAFLVVSEPLDTSERWQKIENNHLVMTDGGNIVSTHPIKFTCYLPYSTPKKR